MFEWLSYSYCQSVMEVTGLIEVKVQLRDPDLNIYVTSTLIAHQSEGSAIVIGQGSGGCDVDETTDRKGFLFCFASK